MVPPSPPYDGNDRVTNAAILSELRGWANETRKDRNATERRITFLEEKHEADMSTLRAIAQQNEKGLAVLQERVATRTGIFGAVQAVGFTIAALLGMKF